MASEKRQLGKTGIYLTPVALGCWPIAGMTSLEVNDDDSRKTIAAAIDSGINFLDTAYCYGPNGESETLIRQATTGQRDQLVIATKCGIHWDENLKGQNDARPERIRLEVEESLQRLGTDRVELLYLHGPDPKIPLEDSAGTLKELMDAGKARAIGVSNLTLPQMKTFQKVCPISAVQLPYNMLQRQLENEIVPWAVQQNASLVIYWPLMKGLLAGKFERDHQFATNDSRAGYPMYQGEEWEKNQTFVDHLRAIASETGHTVAQVVINWTIHQHGITTALCGAKRAYQIKETSQAMNWRLSEDNLNRITTALKQREQDGKAVVSRPV